MPRCVDCCFHIVNRKRALEDTHLPILGMRLYRASLWKAKDSSFLDVVRVNHQQRNCLDTRLRHAYDRIFHKEKARRANRIGPWHRIFFC